MLTDKPGDESARKVVWDDAIISEAFEASSRAARLTAAADSLWEVAAVNRERTASAAMAKVSDELMVKEFVEIAKAKAAACVARRADLAVPPAFLGLLNNMHPGHASREGAYAWFKEKVDKSQDLEPAIREMMLQRCRDYYFPQ